MNYVFLDTMIYLHYTWFEDIDWCELLGSEEFEIVVPHITLDELDTHKDNHKSQKIRERARKVANRLFECITKHVGKVIVVELDESSTFDFEPYNLDTSKNDHRLLAAILQFQESNSENALLVTQDIGPRLKAKRLQLKAIQLPETYRLAPEEDPVVKENRQLKNELLKIQSAMPKLSLEANEEIDGKIELLIHPSTSSGINVEAKMEEIHEKFPVLGFHPDIPEMKGVISSQHLMSARLSQISQSEYDRYNRDRYSYFAQCQEYFSELSRRSRQRQAELNIFIANNGGAPADDVDLYMHFPDGFELYPFGEIPASPKIPKPPEKPKSALQINFGNASRMNFGQVQLKPQNYSNLGLKDPFSLKKTNSYEVNDEFERIKHGQIETTRPLVVVFDSYESASSFQISYRISAANLPQPVEGELNIIIKKQ